MACSARRSMFEKQHTCIGCGCVFRYAMGPRDWRSHMLSQTGKPRDSIRIHPCPDCGLYQPEMVMWFKVWHPLAAFAAVPAFIILGAVCMGSGGANAVLGAQIGVGVFLTLALVHFATAFSNPNGDLEANLATARQELADGQLERVSPGTPGSGSSGPRNVCGWHLPGLAALAAGPAGFLLALVLLSRQPAPPTNDNLHPSVAGPGQKVSFTFTNVNAQAVDGMWRGQPTLRLLNAAEFGLPETIPGTGSDRQWGSQFKVSKGSGNVPLKPTVDFTIPKLDALSGKTLRLSVTMPITYPTLTGPGLMMPTTTKYFRNATSTVSDIITVKVARAEVVQATNQAAALGLGGAGVSFFGALWLTGVAWALLRHSSRCEVVSEPDPEVPQPACGYASGYGPAVDDFDRSMWRDRAGQRQR